MHHVRKVFQKQSKDIELIDERYTILQIGNFKEENAKMYIIHDNETDELSYKRLPVDEKADYEQLLKNSKLR